MKASVETLELRHKIFRFVRDYFDRVNFIEAHTPLLVPNPGLEPHLIPFETQLVAGMGRTQGKTLFLPTSPEYHLKKVLALGFKRVFEITKSFRNGENGAEHEVEFFMLEWYRSPGTYLEIAADFKTLLRSCAEHFGWTNLWGASSDISVREAFASYCQIDLDSVLKDPDSLASVALKAGHKSLRLDDDFESAFNKLVVEKIEPRLGFQGPVFLWDYPAQLCALARISPSNPLYCERFEVYWRSIELANAFGELTDSREQRLRCEADRAKRLSLYGSSPAIDEEFLAALEKLPAEVGGIAVGFDRLIQCFLGLHTLQEAIAFPHSSSI